MDTTSRSGFGTFQGDNREWKKGKAPRHGLTEAEGSGAFKVITKKKVNQEHVILMAPGPAASSPLRYAADTLAMIVGDDSGSRLYWALIDPGLADSADATLDESEGTGATLVSFSGEPEQTQDEIKGINTDARHAALQVALLIPLLAALIGVFTSFRMMRLPDPAPSSPGEAAALG